MLAAGVDRIVTNQYVARFTTRAACKPGHALLHVDAGTMAAGLVNSKRGRCTR